MATGSQDKFAFGIWCVTNRGADPFGDQVRGRISAIDAIRGLARRGYWGFEFHDNDLWPIGATAKQIDKTVADVKKVMRETGIRCASGTTNLFYHPVFKDGAFTSHDPQVRAYAVAKALRAIDAAAELDADNFIFWGGREGAEVDAAKDPVEALKRFREAISFLVDYIVSSGYRMTVTIEPKPNEPRGDLYLPAVGNALAFIATLPARLGKRVGVNPEYAHIKMAGLNVLHEFGQALEAGKLFELHLNDQVPLRYDQDLAFGSSNPKEALLLVRMLRRHGFDGIVAFDCHPYRTEDEAGVWDFVERNMRNYRLLAERADLIDADPRLRELLAEVNPGGRSPHAKFSRDAARKLKAAKFDPDKLARSRRLAYERLDQVFTELVIGLQ